MYIPSNSIRQYKVICAPLIFVRKRGGGASVSPRLDGNVIYVIQVTLFKMHLCVGGVLKWTKNTRFINMDQLGFGCLFARDHFLTTKCEIRICLITYIPIHVIRQHHLPTRMWPHCRHAENKVWGLEVFMNISPLIVATHLTILVNTSDKLFNWDAKILSRCMTSIFW